MSPAQAPAYRAAVPDNVAVRDRLRVPMDVRLRVLRELQGFEIERDLIGQEVAWRPARWQVFRGFEGQLAQVRKLSTPTYRPGWLGLTRGTVLGVGEGSSDPIQVFFAAMVFGFGSTGRTWQLEAALGIRKPKRWRTVDPEVARQRIRALWTEARRDPVAAFAASVPREGHLHLPGIGMSFATKFIYLSGFTKAKEDGRLPPLILDENVTRALGLKPLRTNDSRVYHDYLEWAANLSEGRRADLVELALFFLGRRERQASRRRSTDTDT